MKKSILIVFMIFANSSLYANTIQSLDLLKNKIEEHVLDKLSNYSEGTLQVSAGKIQSRLTLKTCSDDKLQIFNPYQTPMLSTHTMGVKCLEENNHWTLYVPIKIVVLKTVIVAKRSLIKGSVLTQEDIYQTEMDAQKLKRGYFIESKELVGLVCKQDISADSPLTPHNIELAKLVHIGEQVTIIASNNNLSISMDGIALNEGALGEMVKVKNLKSKRIIEAAVAGDKKVKVIL